jgi:hypothetical protein
MLIAQVLVFLVAGSLAAWAVGVLWRAQGRYPETAESPQTTSIGEMDQAAATASDRIQALEDSNRTLKEETEQAKAELERLRRENETLTERLDELTPKAAVTERPITKPSPPDEAADKPAPPSARTPTHPTPPANLRMLNSDQFQNVAANLKRFSGTPIDLWQISDPEATALAEQIKTLLTTAGWTVKTTKFGALSPPRYGVSIVHRGNPAAAALARSLQAAGMSATEESDIGGTVVIVGLKPAD